MFTQRSLRDYMSDVFMKTTEVFVKKLDELSVNEDSVDLYDMFNRLTLEAFTQGIGMPPFFFFPFPSDHSFSLPSTN